VVLHIWIIKARERPDTDGPDVADLFPALISERLSPSVYLKWAYSLNLLHSPARSSRHAFPLLPTLWQTGSETFHIGFTAQGNNVEAGRSGAWNGPALHGWRSCWFPPFQYSL